MSGHRASDEFFALIVLQRQLERRFLLVVKLRKR
jgi:hypothetical protein